VSPPSPPSGRVVIPPDLLAAYQAAKRHADGVEEVKRHASLLRDRPDMATSDRRAWVVEKLRELQSAWRADLAAIGPVLDELSLARCLMSLHPIRFPSTAFLDTAHANTAHTATLLLSLRALQAVGRALTESRSARLADTKRWELAVTPGALAPLADLDFVGEHLTDVCRRFSVEGLPEAARLRAEAEMEMRRAAVNRSAAQPPAATRGAIPPDRFVWGPAEATGLSLRQWRLLQCLCDGDQLRPAVSVPEVIKHVYAGLHRPPGGERAILAIRLRVNDALAAARPPVRLTVENDNGSLHLCPL
jgi:hypothetical protein